MHDEDRIERSIILPQRRALVWEALTDPRLLGSWLQAFVDLDPRPGGHARFRPDHGPVRLGRVQDVRDGRRLAFTWWPEDIEEAATQVELTLGDEPGGTRLTIVETGFSVLAHGPMASLTHDWGWGIVLAGTPRLVVGHASTLAAARV